MTQINKVLKRTAELTEQQKKSSKSMTQSERAVTKAYKGRANVIEGALLRATKALEREDSRLVSTDKQRARQAERMAQINDHLAITQSKLVRIQQQWEKSLGSSSKLQSSVIRATRAQTREVEKLTKAQQRAAKVRSAERLAGMPSGAGFRAMGAAATAISAGKEHFYLSKVAPQLADVNARAARGLSLTRERAISTEKAYRRWSQSIRVTSREMERLSRLGMKVPAPGGIAGVNKFAGGLASVGAGAAKGAAGLYKMATRMSWHLFLFEQGARQIALFAGGIAKLAAEGAKIRTMEDSFERLNQVAGRVDMGEMRDALKGTVSDVKIMEMANLARQLQIGAQDIPKLAEVAKAAAQSLGMDTEQMYGDIIRGTARYSKKILDNLGIRMENLSSLWKRHAERMGKSAQDLTEEEKNRIFVQQVLANSDKILAAAGEDHAGTYQRQAVTIENLTNKGKKWFDSVVRNSGVLEFFGQMINDVTDFLAKNDDSIQRVIESLFSFARTSANLFKSVMDLASVGLPFLSRSLQGVMETAEIASIALGQVTAVFGGDEEGGLADMADFLMETTSPAVAFSESMKNAAREINGTNHAASILIQTLEKGVVTPEQQLFLGLKEKSEKDRQAILNLYKELGNDEAVRRIEEFYEDLAVAEKEGAEKAREEALTANKKLAGDILKMPSMMKTDEKSGEMFQSIWDIVIVPEENMQNMAKKYVDQVDHLIADLEDGSRDLTDGFGDLTDEQIKDMQTQVFSSREEFGRMQDEWRQSAPEQRERLVASWMMATFGDPATFLETQQWEEYMRIHNATIQHGFGHFIKVTDAILDEFSKGDIEKPKRGRSRRKKTGSAKAFGKRFGFPETGEIEAMLMAERARLDEVRDSSSEYFSGYFKLVEDFDQFQFEIAKQLEGREAGGLATRAWAAVQAKEAEILDDIDKLAKEGQERLSGTLSDLSKTYERAGLEYREADFPTAKLLSQMAESQEKALKGTQDELKKAIAEMDGMIDLLDHFGLASDALEEKRQSIANRLLWAPEHMRTGAGLRAGMGSLTDLWDKQAAALPEGIGVGVGKTEEWWTQTQERIQPSVNLFAESFAVTTQTALEQAFKDIMRVDAMNLGSWAESMGAIVGDVINNYGLQLGGIVNKALATAVGGVGGGVLGMFGGGIVGGIVGGLGSFVERLFQRDKEKDRKTNEAIKRIAEKKRDITVNMEIVNHGLATDDYTARRVHWATKRALELGER